MTKINKKPLPRLLKNLRNHFIKEAVRMGNTDAEVALVFNLTRQQIFNIRKELDNSLTTDRI